MEGLIEEGNFLLWTVIDFMESVGLIEEFIDFRKLVGELLFIILSV